MVTDNADTQSDAARLDRHVQRILRDRVRSKLARRIKDPATLDRIAYLIEGAAPQAKKRSRRRAA